MVETPPVTTVRQLALLHTVFWANTKDCMGMGEGREGGEVQAGHSPVVVALLKPGSLVAIVQLLMSPLSPSTSHMPPG